MVCLTHYLRRRRERLLTEDAGLVIEEFRVEGFPKVMIQRPDIDPDAVVVPRVGRDEIDDDA